MYQLYVCSAAKVSSLQSPLYFYYTYTRDISLQPRCNLDSFHSLYLSPLSILFFFPTITLFLSIYVKSSLFSAMRQTLLQRTPSSLFRQLLLLLSFVIFFTLFGLLQLKDSKYSRISGRSCYQVINEILDSLSQAIFNYEYDGTGT